MNKTVTFKGKALVGSITVGQRIMLHRLTGEDTHKIRLSKAEASVRISKLLKAKPADKKPAPVKKLTGEATVGQRVLLHHLTGKDTRNVKLSKADAAVKIAKLLAK